MIRTTLRIALVSSVLGCVAGPAAAQEAAAPVAVPGGEITCTLLHNDSANLTTFPGILLERGIDCLDEMRHATDEIIDGARELLGSPDTHSRVLNALIAGDHGWQFLKDIDFKVKTFEADDGGEAGLGFSYEYSKSLQGHDVRCARAACIRGLDLQFDANGNVAVDSDRNPNDFLETHLSFAFFQSLGGVSQPSEQTRRQFTQLQRAFIAAEGDSDEEEQAVRDIEKLVRPLLSDQFYWEIAGDTAFESDQKFEATQWTYGFHAAFDIKAWNDSSPFATFNLFDYPFAALRTLSGYGPFKPSGTAWPSLLIGLDQVDPGEDTPRALAGETGSFDRLRFEASFRTAVARHGNDDLYVSVNYRYYKERNAPAVVRDLELDSFRYVTVVLGGNNGLYVSYTDGKLPLDVADDRVFELGYQFHR
jgi:hypothetical protein